MFKIDNLINRFTMIIKNQFNNEGYITHINVSWDKN